MSRRASLTAFAVYRARNLTILTLVPYNQKSRRGTRSNKREEGPMESTLCSNISVKSKPWRQGAATAGPKAWSARLGHASKTLVAREALVCKSKAMERAHTECRDGSLCPPTREGYREVQLWVGVWRLASAKRGGCNMVAIASARSATFHVRTRMNRCCLRYSAQSTIQPFCLLSSYSTPSDQPTWRPLTDQLTERHSTLVLQSALQDRALHLTLRIGPFLGNVADKLCAGQQTLASARTSCKDLMHAPS
jgi:hypothetical protein